MKNDAAIVVLVIGLAAMGAAWWFRDRVAADEGGAVSAIFPELSNGISGTLDAANEAAATVSGALSPVIYAIGDAIGMGQTQTEARTISAEDNVQAFLMMIRTCEGTADAAGYRRMFGGELFSSFADHPRVTVRRSGYVSTAAGAYQFLSRTWDDARRALSLPDFSPASQDAAAVWLLRRRGALSDVRAGNFDIAVKKCALEWASLPGSPYGQPVKSIQQARAAYASAGGTFA